MGTLDGATAIVTGATRGVGRGCALELASQGVKVYITGRTVREGDSQHPGSLESTVEAARALGGEVVSLHRDRIGGLELPADLDVGEVRPLDPEGRTLLLSESSL